MKTALTTLYHGALFLFVCVALTVAWFAGARDIAADLNEANGEDTR